MVCLDCFLFFCFKTNEPGALKIVFLLSHLFQVTPGSKAAQANLCIGDIFLAIDGESTENMTHMDAQNKIKGCGDELVLSIDRYVATCRGAMCVAAGRENSQ